ncbi:MAG: hypothetical protein LWX07_11810 [Bacteroidetes bacterium]|nr:hypothetical protein [Bacteroidota bacterium]
MTTRKTLLAYNTFYYFTITCYKWLRLFEITGFYEEIYKWFEILYSKNVFISAYIIMPNHLHALIFCKNDFTPVNKIISNGKRFMAYEIISRLRREKEFKILNFLSAEATRQCNCKGAIHKVFEPSFDLKEVISEKFLFQKINYIHLNPVSKKWNLAETYLDYSYSSARFYEGLPYTGYPVIHYLDIIEKFFCPRVPG